MQLDTLQDLGLLIWQEMQRTGRCKPAWLFKSDVSEVYRQIPMHPHWQVRQATEWMGPFMSIAVPFSVTAHLAGFGPSSLGLSLGLPSHVYVVAGLLAYVDDTFSFDSDNQLYLYKGPSYSKLIPQKQRQLLRLWDSIGIKHDKKKQEHGHKLTIIGFTVDLDTMTISMTANKRKELVLGTHAFTDPPQQMHPLQSWL